VRIGHSERIWSIAPSPHGVFATASKDKTIKLWDSESAQDIGTLTGHKGWVLCATFSKDGKLLATASMDKTIRVWDCINKTLCQTLPGHGTVYYCDFSPCSNFMIGANGELVNVWDINTGKEIGKITFPSKAMYCKFFNEGDQFCAIAGGAEQVKVKIFDFAKKMEIATLVHESPVNFVVCSEDGKKIVTGCADGMIKIWNSVNFQEIYSLKGHTIVLDARFLSTDNTNLYVAFADGSICVYDISAAKPKFLGYTFLSSISTAALVRKTNTIVCADQSGALFFLKLHGF